MLVSFRETIIDGTNETESDRPSHIWCVRARRVGLLLFRSLGFFVFFEDPSATTSMTCIIFFYFGYYFNVVIHSHNWPQCWFSVYRYYEEICAKSLLIDGFDENEFWTNRFFICIHSGSVYWTHKCIMMRIGWYGWEFRLVFFFRYTNFKWTTKRTVVIAVVPFRGSNQLSISTLRKIYNYIATNPNPSVLLLLFLCAVCTEEKQRSQLQFAAHSWIEENMQANFLPYLCALYGRKK